MPEERKTLTWRAALARLIYIILAFANLRDTAGH